MLCHDKLGTSVTLRAPNGVVRGLSCGAAAGLVLGESIERPGAVVLVGDLPQWAVLGVEGPAALIGLDALGPRFRIARDASAAPPRKKSRRRGAGGDSGGGAWTLVVEG